MSLLMLFAIPAAVAAVLAWLLTPAAIYLGGRFGVLDHPGPRKLHARVVPRTGGLAVVTSVYIVIAAIAVLHWSRLPLLPADFSAGAALGVLPIFIVSLIDDARSLGALPRLLAQVIGAAIAITFGVTLPDSIHLFGASVPLDGLAIPLTFLWMVGVTNAFNIIDGLDGLSAGLALISALSLAAIAMLTQNGGLALTALILVGALVGFLPYNTYPARVFLGDSGAASLGFWLACLALPGGSTLSAGMAVGVPILAMGVPIAETLISMVRRLLRRLGDRNSGHPFQADAEHIHHRLVRMGIDQRKAVLMLYAAAVATSLIGILSLFVTHANAALLLGSLMAAAFIGVGRLGYDEFAMIRRGIVLRFYDSPVLKIGFFRVFVDMSLAAGALYVAMALNAHRWSVAGAAPLLLEYLSLVLPVCVCSFWSFRLYQRAWRFASIDDVVDASLAVLVCGAASFLLVRLVIDSGASAAVFGTFTMILLLLAGGGRSSFRVLEYWRDRTRREGRRVLLYGAGVCGTMAIREMQSNLVLDLRPIGFIDDDPLKCGRRISGYPVLGPSDQLEAIARRHRIHSVMVSSDKISPQRIAAVMAACQRLDLDLLRFSLDVRTLRVSGVALGRADTVASPGV